MQLHYRGISYSTHPCVQPQAIDRKETGISASFRGGSYPLYRSATSMNLTPPVALTYRGVAYGVPHPAGAVNSSLQQFPAAI